MKATGIIRRIDDLGRVVIPKEIRKNMNIQDGEPLEIFTDNDMVCFKKYSDPSVREAIENILTASRAVCEWVCGVLYENEVFGTRSYLSRRYEDAYGNLIGVYYSTAPSEEDEALVQKIIYAFTD